MPPEPTLAARWYERAEALIARAAALDRGGRAAEACALYREAAAGVLAGVRCDQRGDAFTVPAVRRANQALDRVVELEAFAARARQRKEEQARAQQGAVKAPAPVAAPAVAVPSSARTDVGAVLLIGADDADRRADEEYSAARRAALAAPGRRFLDVDFVPGLRSLGRGAELEVNFSGTGRIKVPVVWRRPEELVDEAGLAAVGSTLDIARDLERLAQRPWPDDAGPDSARAPPASHLSFLLEQARIHRANRGGVHPPRGGAAAWCFKRNAEFRAEDVKQGGLGTCWLDSSISLIATREALLRRLFREEPFEDARRLLAVAASGAAASAYSSAVAGPAPGAVTGAGAVAGAISAFKHEPGAISLHPLGIYQVRLFIDGRWLVVTIDGQLPSSGFSGEPAFSAALRRQAWVPLLEKAVAKASGSYARLAGGQAGEALRLFTGAPVLALHVRTNETQAACALRHNSPDGVRCEWEQRPLQPVPAATLDALWARLLGYYRAGFLLGASATDSPPFDAFAPAEREAFRARLRAQGVVLNHSYALLRVLEAREAGGERLLQLRNPWASGRGESGAAAGLRGWCGPWCDSSPEWARAPQALRDACSPYGADVGIFWMRLADFAACFRRVDVAKVRGFDPMTGRVDAARAWSTLRAELPLPRQGFADVVVLRVRVAADCDLDLVASIALRCRRQRGPLLTAAATPAGGATSPVVWRRRSSEADADTGGNAAAASGGADNNRDLGLLVLEELPSVAAARLAAAAAPSGRARASIEATGMRVLHFAEPCEERRCVGHEAAMAECRLEGPAAGASDSNGFRSYYVVVLSLSGLGSAAAAPTALFEVHSSGVVVAECVARPLSWLSRALVARTLALEDATPFEPSRRGGAPVSAEEKRALDAAHAVYAHLDGGGAVFAAVNRHPVDSFLARSTVDAMGDPIVSRRAAAAPSSARGSAGTSDTLPPLHAQLLQLASYSAVGRAMSVSSGRTTGGAVEAAQHSPPLDALFAPFPLFIS